MHELQKQLQQYGKNKANPKSKIQFTVTELMNNALNRFAGDKSFIDKQDAIRFILMQTLRKEGYMQ